MESIADNLLIGIVVTDLESNIKYVNSKCSNYFKKETIYKIIKNLKRSPNLVVINGQEFVIQKLNNDNNPKENNYIYMILPIEEIIHIIPEISHVRQKNKKFQEILNCIHDRIYVSDNTGKILMANKAVERDGEKVEKLVGRNMADLVKEGYMQESLTLKVLKTKKSEGVIFQEPEGYELLAWAIPHFKNNEIDFVVCTEWDLETLSNIKERLKIDEEIPDKIRDELAYHRKRSSLSDKIVAVSPQMKKLIETSSIVARSDSIVLIQGESGTGKEVLMKYIHSHSPRSNSPLIVVNCGAIPENLIESELFGYEKGAFTGADPKGKTGFFELAHKGTLFLDEIGELSLPAQAKLLRAIQEKEIIKIGGNVPISIDVRIIAATNVDLLEAVNEKRFRKDLFYRLNVIPLFIPPLKERKEDIPHLVQHFEAKYNIKHKTRKTIDADDMDIFINYSWPGNIRELKNLIERVLIITAEEKIPRESWMQQLFHNTPQSNYLEKDDIISLKQEIELFEKELLISYLPYYKNSRQFAKMLDVEKTTILRKFKKYNITP